MPPITPVGIVPYQPTVTIFQCVRVEPQRNAERPVLLRQYTIAGITHPCAAAALRPGQSTVEPKRARANASRRPTHVLKDYAIVKAAGVSRHVALPFVEGPATA